MGEVFINDAFGTTHRRHASNYGISSILPSAYGFLINEELVGLDPIINNIKRPFTVIMGGAKVDDKVALIETLLEESDYILVGGGIANTFLKSAGYNIGTSLYSEEYVDKIKNLISKYQDKIIMPIDVIVKEYDKVYKTDIDSITTDSAIYDIG
ncbi:MAG: phosphoglycerate kinase, partial [Bacilli bacterium]|nr:phosphoglycerate kinase [Bacilli bacterium]